MSSPRRKIVRMADIHLLFTYKYVLLNWGGGGGFPTSIVDKHRAL